MSFFSIGRKKSRRVESTYVPDSQVDRRAFEIGSEMLHVARENRAGLISARFWQDQLMDWAMKDEAFKVQMFRFVDVFPMLYRSDMVHDYLVDYLSQPDVTLPPGMRLGLKAGSLAKGLMSKTIATQVTRMAKSFIAGVDAASAIPRLRKLWDSEVAFTVDLLGEACVSDDEVEVYQRRYLDLVETLPEVVRSWPDRPALVCDYIGPLPATNVSIKISSLCARCDPIDFEGTLARMTETLDPILEAACRHDVGITFDMEQYALKELTFALFERCCERHDFTASIAVQSYLRSGDEDARRLIDWARRTGRQVTVRLIKGAYWDYEVIHAEQQGWPLPVWPVKRMTDACFERMAELFIKEMPRAAGEAGVKLALGSHNIRSIAWALAQLERHDLPPTAIETQKLYGMGDELKIALRERGLRTREYVPIGEMIPGMAYFVRRLLENTSNESWLRAGFGDNVSEDVLLASPHTESGGEGEEESAVAAKIDAAIPTADPERHRLSDAVEGLGDGRPMINEPCRDFSDQGQREAFDRALRAAGVPAIKKQATHDDTLEAIAKAETAAPAWGDMDPVERSAIITRAAGIMRDRRDTMSGIMVREAGKTWREADGDTCEAIDFCEFYARAAVRLFQPARGGQYIGELNHNWHQPLGIVSVISPWNFPLAICCGMTVAALATGNAVLVKPSSQTRGIALDMCEALWNAGVPRDVLHFLPGPGREVGSVMTSDPRIAMIAFTGSKEVGLHIWRTAGDTLENQGHLKRVVCEMGGKNAIIVDESADLDEAVLGVRQSAFGYSGQKCSACSRAIVVGRANERFLGRIVGATRTLVVGDPALPETDIGPIIDESAATGIREYIEIGRSEGRLVFEGAVPEGLEASVGMPYVAPHIFADVEPNHRIAREEIFGPVLSIIRADSFDDALRIANDSEYKLTGGVFSRKPEHLEMARRRFRVGNLYLNRGCTGAQVGRQPFGGFGMSGGGTKAGGAEYLLHFVNPRTCTENTMRHGFSPGLG